MPKTPKKNTVSYTIGIALWKDAYEVRDIEDPSVLEPHANMMTIGIPVKVTPEAISLAAERCLDDGGLRGVTTIPRIYLKDYWETTIKRTIPSVEVVVSVLP